MLEKKFLCLVDKFKMHFYKQIFSQFQSREASLTTVETFCVEVIHALGRPTVNELVQFVEISQPNAAYKVASLVKKGYVNRVQSQKDKREYHLEVTDKFYDYYAMNSNYISIVAKRMKERFSAEEIQQFENMLDIVSSELMPEVANVRE